MMIIKQLDRRFKVLQLDFSLLNNKIVFDVTAYKVARPYVLMYTQWRSQKNIIGGAAFSKTLNQM